MSRSSASVAVLASEVARRSVARAGGRDSPRLVAVGLLAADSRPSDIGSSRTASPPTWRTSHTVRSTSPAVATCLFSSTTSTTFEIGSTTVTSSSPTTLSLGLKYTKSGQPVVVLPDDGTQALQSPAIPVPGGLTGISGLGRGSAGGDGHPPAPRAAHREPRKPADGKRAGPDPADRRPGEYAHRTARSRLHHWRCRKPDRPRPDDRHDQPAGPNTPISGSPGDGTTTSKGLITVSGMTLVDNSFAVPGADNCGPGGILDPILDLEKGLPSPAGSNTAILSGSSYTAPATLVRKYLH